MAKTGLMAFVIFLLVMFRNSDARNYLDHYTFLHGDLLSKNESEETLTVFSVKNSPYCSYFKVKESMNAGFIHLAPSALTYAGFEFPFTNCIVEYTPHLNNESGNLPNNDLWRIPFFSLNEFNLSKIISFGINNVSGITKYFIQQYDAVHSNLVEGYSLIWGVSINKCMT